MMVTASNRCLSFGILRMSHANRRKYKSENLTQYRAVAGLALSKGFTTQV
jgi:hypothetical protein